MQLYCRKNQQTVCTCSLHEDLRGLCNMLAHNCFFASINPLTFRSSLSLFGICFRALVAWLRLGSSDLIKLKRQTVGDDIGALCRHLAELVFVLLRGLPRMLRVENHKRSKESVESDQFALRFRQVKALFSFAPILSKVIFRFHLRASFPDSTLNG